MPKWRIGIILWMCNLSQEKTQCEISIYDCNCLKFLFTEMTNYSPDSSVPLKEKYSMLSWKHSKFFTTRHDKIIVRCHQIFNRMHSLQELHVREHLLCNSVPGTIAMGEIPLPFYRAGDRRYQLLARMS